MVVRTHAGDAEIDDHDIQERRIGQVHERLLGRRPALCALAEREHALAWKLAESPRNLYGLELVSLASVTIAPDSMQRTPEDNSTATIRVAISTGKLAVSAPAFIPTENGARATRDE